MMYNCELQLSILRNDLLFVKIRRYGHVIIVCIKTERKKKPEVLAKKSK